MGYGYYGGYYGGYGGYGGWQYGSGGGYYGAPEPYGGYLGGYYFYYGDDTSGDLGSGDYGGYTAYAQSQGATGDVSQEIVVTARKGADTGLSDSGLNPAIYVTGYANGLPTIQPISSAPTLPAKFENFFNKLLGPATKVANDLHVPVQYILGLAALESGYFSDQHDIDLNNVFGATKGGGNDLHFGSVQESFNYFESSNAWRFTGGATTIDQFEQDLQKAPAYNSANPDYYTTLSGIIGSVTSRLAIYNHEHST